MAFYGYHQEFPGHYPPNLTGNEYKEKQINAKQKKSTHKKHPYEHNAQEISAHHSHQPMTGNEL
ncbi:MAG: hypothetical protein NC311_20265 [Muribaculaceae bacterium]|nr:hypothetical protein [Muribaculaceae bacterium]